MSFKDWVKKHKITTIIIILIIISILAIAYIRFFVIYHGYHREINRNIDNIEEEKALEIVENYNYSEVFDIERFTDASMDWANFIDLSIIDHYNSKYESLREQDAKHNVDFIYKAEVYKIQELILKYDFIPVYEEYSLKIYDANERIVNIRGEVLPNIIASFNETTFTLQNKEMDFKINFSNVYLVNLELDYSDQWGPLAGYGVQIYQVVVLDMNFQPLFIFIDPEQWIS